MARAAHIAVPGVLATLALGGCLLAHPVFAGDASDTWGADLDCAGCHAKEASAFEEADAGEAAEEGKQGEKGIKADADAARKDSEGRGGASQAQAGDTGSDADAFLALHGALGCATCHDDAKLPELHEDAAADGKMPKKLKKTAVSEEACLGCHGPHEELAKLTEGCGLLTDDKGTTVNPHALPDVADHDPIGCTDCHTVHKGKTVEETAPAKCLSCHHENVYECGTCH